MIWTRILAGIGGVVFYQIFLGKHWRRAVDRWLDRRHNDGEEHA